MQGDRVFVDTDIIIYAYDMTAGRKQGKGGVQKALNSQWTKEFGCSGAEVTRYPGVTTSCVNRAVSESETEKFRLEP